MQLVSPFLIKFIFIYKHKWYENEINYFILSFHILMRNILIISNTKFQSKSYFKTQPLFQRKQNMFRY
jgi:hypothetical protein